MPYIEFDVLIQSRGSLRDNPITFKLQPLQNTDGHRYTLVEFVEELKTSVWDILSKINNLGTIDVFTFGKTFAKVRTGLTNLDPMDTSTWDETRGVKERWEDQYTGYTGLVILCAVPKGFLPPRGALPPEGLSPPEDREMLILTSENYVLALVEQLIHHYAFTERNSWLGNTSLNPGHASPEEAGAYVLYLAFKLKDKEDEKKKKEMTAMKTTDKKDEMKEIEDSIKKTTLK